MRNACATIVGTTVLGILLAVNAYAQAEGDYRSASSGDWSAASTWEVYSGGAWTAAATAPTGAETITVDGSDSVSVDVAVSITGLVRVTETGELNVGAGALEFADGSTYEHARDAGDVPLASWATGSTFLLTGTVQDAPGNRSQDFHHLVINTPDLGRNRDLGLDDVTIGGDITVQNTGANRWQLTSASAQDSSIFTIMGDVIVEDGTFAVQGTGNALTTFEVHHHGDIEVTGGNFSVARGSQGSGSGTTTWFLYGGDLSMSDAATQNSNPTPGAAKFVFAGNGTQQMSFQNVEYAGGQIHYEVSDSTTLEIVGDFEVNGLLVNRGEVTPTGNLTFLDEAVYEHAQNGGTVPDATWAEGSTALFTGIEGDAPDNRGQDYYHLTLDTPGLSSNRDMDLGGHTIGGDLSVLNSGSSRWRLVGGDSAMVTIMGDVIVRDAALETQGTGSPTEVIVHHYGNIDVDGGNLSVSRGSQGGGTGTTTWYLYQGDFMMANARTQNSNPTAGNAKFVFASDSTQNLVLGENNTIDDLSIAVSDSTTLDLGESVITGDGVFILQGGATVAVGHPDGLLGNLQTTGEISLADGAIMYSGAVAQSLGMLPDSLNILTIANAEGVTASDTVFVNTLNVNQGGTLVVDSTGSITAVNGSINGTIVNHGELLAEDALTFGPTAVYEHARNEGTVPEGVWEEGSTAMITGITTDAPDNRGQDYHHLVLNTPDLLSNRDMDLGGHTIGGDLSVLSSGGSRWRLVGGDSAMVTIVGDVIVRDASLETQGTSSPSEVIIHHYGNIDVNGGEFSVSRGSQGGGTGKSIWYLYDGDFSLTDARTRNSNETPGNARFVFARSGSQMLTLGGENTIDDLSIEVSDSTTLDVGVSEIGGDGIFWMQPGATLATAHPDGVAGSLQTTGELLLDGRSFSFYGGEPQVTSDLMPTTVDDLIISNVSGVTLSQETTINGALRLIAGEFDNTVPFTLGPDGVISREGGSVLITTDTEEAPDVPTEFALHQNYPNPFNPSTMIGYDVKERAEVTVTIYDVTGRSVLELVRGPHAPGRYQVEWNAAGLSSGVYFYHIRAGEWTATKSLLLVK